MAIKVKVTYWWVYIYTYLCSIRVEKPCPKGWWGSPMCGPCNCDINKGFNPDCNKTTGECRCKVHSSHIMQTGLKSDYLYFLNSLLQCILDCDFCSQNILLELSCCENCKIVPMNIWAISISRLSSQDNYYRPKDSDTCYPCNCFFPGASSRTCDPQTGQCPCKAGVIGRQCNRCDNPFAEVTNSGCEGAYLQPGTLSFFYLQ